MWKTVCIAVFFLFKKAVKSILRAYKTKNDSVYSCKEKLCKNEFKPSKSWEYFW